MVIDSKQRNEVTSNLKTSFFVDAGAGAGKTKLIAFVIEPFSMFIHRDREYLTP